MRVIIYWQAVEVYLCRLKPVDNDIQFTEAANREVADKIGDKELTGTVVLCLGGTLWLDPLVERVYQPNINQTVDNNFVRPLLLDGKFAESNPNHLESLYELCRNCSFPVPLLDSRNSAHTVRGQVRPTRTETLPSTEEFIEVAVSAICTPDLFYVQLTSHNDMIETLANDINEHMKRHDDSQHFEIKRDLLVAAKHTWDKRLLLFVGFSVIFVRSGKQLHLVLSLLSIV